jgi:hypothetical protein
VLFATFSVAGPKHGLSPMQRTLKLPFPRVIGKVFARIGCVSTDASIPAISKARGYVTPDQYEFEVGNTSRWCWTLGDYVPVRVNFDFHDKWGGGDGGVFGELFTQLSREGENMVLGSETVIANACFFC